MGIVMDYEESICAAVLLPTVDPMIRMIPTRHSGQRLGSSDCSRGFGATYGGKRVRQSERLSFRLRLERKPKCLIFTNPHGRT